MTLEMRELRGDDLFSLLSIVGKLDIKDEFVKMFEKNIEDAGKTPEDHKEKKLTKAEQAKIDKKTWHENNGSVASKNIAESKEREIRYQ